MPIVLLLALLIFGSLVAASMPVLVGLLAMVGALALVRVITTVHRRLGLLGQRHLAARHRAGDRLRAVHDQPVPRGAGAAARRRPRRAGDRDPPHDDHGGPDGALLRPDGRGRDVVPADLPAGVPASIGYGGIAAVLVAMLAALTVLPAMLRLLGRRVDAGRLPWRRHRPSRWRTRTGAGPPSPAV